MSSYISNIDEKQIYHSSGFPISLRNHDRMTSMSSNWDGNKLVRRLLKIKPEMLKTLSVEADVGGSE